MLPALIIVFREGFESFLIVAIILAYLNKTDQVWLKSTVYIGIVVSIFTSALLGYVMINLNQPLWEGIFGIISIILVTSFVIHLWKTAPRLKQKMERRLTEVTSSVSRIFSMLGVFLFTVMMITREGMETAMMLIQVRDSQFVFGSIAGLIAAAALSFSWVKFGRKIDLKRFFQVTGIFLLLFTIQIAIYSLHEFSEAGLLPDADAIHIATEPFSAIGLYGKWFSLMMICACGMWLTVVTVKDRFQQRAVLTPVPEPVTTREVRSYS